MARYFFRPVGTKTIVHVLHYLRSSAVRDGKPGLEHIDALLRLHGVEPESLPIPQKRVKPFSRGKLRIAVMQALRQGPMKGADLARLLAVEGLTYKTVYKRVYQCLGHMQEAGLVRREAGRWELHTAP